MGDYWQLTVDILQNESSPIVDKPKLQEKYLTKPPFRYLHDLITAVSGNRVFGRPAGCSPHWHTFLPRAHTICRLDPGAHLPQVQNNTGFAPGLYSGEELDAKGIQVKLEPDPWTSQTLCVQLVCQQRSHSLRGPCFPAGQGRQGGLPAEDYRRGLHRSQCARASKTTQGRHVQRLDPIHSSSASVTSSYHGISEQRLQALNQQPCARPRVLFWPGSSDQSVLCTLVADCGWSGA